MRPTIKSLDELHRIAINSDEVIGFVKILINEIEAAVLKSLQTQDSKAVIPIYYDHYNLSSFNKLDAVRIITYNLIQILHEKKYDIKLEKVSKGLHLIINLSNISGTSASLAIDNYLSQFLSK